MTGRTSGDAKWYFAPQAVIAGATYQYADWYQSNVATQIDAVVTLSDGSVKYIWLGDLAPASAWTQAQGTFVAPAGAVSVTVYHVIYANGFLTTDDFSLAPVGRSGGGGTGGGGTATMFNRGLVSVTLDDGWTNQYDNARPVLSKYGLPATFYIISGTLTDQPAYMSGSQVQALANAGHETASHTVSHAHLTSLSAANLDYELRQSQATLQNLLGRSVTNFAYPYGEYNSTTIAAAGKYYGSQRTVDDGFNTKSGYNRTKLKVQNIYSYTTPAQVQGWINQAAQNKSWLILVYHEVATAPYYPSDADYTTSPAQFDSEMAAVKNSGLGVLTVQQALNEIAAQL